MSSMRASDFSLAAVYSALDARRRARGRSWPQATRDINREHELLSVRPVSASTVTGMRTQAVAEADGVLQMLLWLRRTPESFVPDHPWAEANAARLLAVPPHQILRFDTKKLHAAIDALRLDRNMTWI